MNAKQKRAVVYFIGLLIIIFSNVVTVLGMDFMIFFVVAVAGFIISVPVSMLLYRKWRAEEVRSIAAKKAIEGKQRV